MGVMERLKDRETEGKVRERVCKCMCVCVCVYSKSVYLCM